MKHPLVIFIFLVFLYFTSFAQKDQQQKAIQFIEALSVDQAKKVIQKIEDPYRDDWHYFPPSMFSRQGIMVKELSQTQKELLQKLMRSFLSEKGVNKTNQIIQLEGILGQLSGNNSYRDPGKYYIAFYGNPKKDVIWAWRIEGHHLSLNFTVANGETSYAPRFFGANPAIVESGRDKGLNVLKNEENLGLQLINSLTDSQKSKAIIQGRTYGDIVTGNKSEVEPLKIQGIAMTQLTAGQTQILTELIYEYISSVSEEAAQSRFEKIRGERDKIWFAWAGQTELGMPHYYRIQSETFLIEFDNSQGNANHIHCVWREFEGDFGRDILKEHYQRSSHHKN